MTESDDNKMQGDNVSTTGMDHGRKSSKPIMEKRRRARINASLAELKKILLDAIENQGTRHSKMEKADILELTVKHLKRIQQQHYASSQSPSPTTPPSLQTDTYQSGFRECTSEVRQYFETSQDVSSNIRSHLLDHLNTCLNRLSPLSNEEVPRGSFAITEISNIVNSPRPAFNTSSMVANVSILGTSNSPNDSVYTKTLMPADAEKVTNVLNADLKLGLDFPSLVNVFTPTLQPATHPLSSPSTISNLRSLVSHNEPTQTLSQPNIINTNSNSPYTFQSQQGHLQSTNLSSLNLIPTKLPNGDIVFVLPSLSQIPNYVIPLISTPTQIQIPSFQATPNVPVCDTSLIENNPVNDSTPGYMRPPKSGGKFQKFSPTSVSTSPSKHSTTFTKLAETKRKTQYKWKSKFSETYKSSVAAKLKLASKENAHIIKPETEHKNTDDTKDNVVLLENSLSTIKPKISSSSSINISETTVSISDKEHSDVLKVNVGDEFEQSSNNQSNGTILKIFNPSLESLHFTQLPSDRNRLDDNALKTTEIEEQQISDDEVTESTDAFPKPEDSDNLWRPW